MGRIFDIQRFSVHDGPGIRTTVFLKGCPLRCVWCHNPEGINAAPMVSFLPEKCLACGECVRACVHDAHRLEGSDVIGHPVVHLYNRDACETCGSCTRYCDSGALEFVGRPMSVEDVMKEVSQDQPFYASSGGGMTISGGEPLAQIDFTIALLRAAKEQGIHRCVETSGFASWERFPPLLPLVDLFLFDCKETDPQRHKVFTGQSNQLILENLWRLHEAGARVQLQCPIVPGFNDREDHFDRNCRPGAVAAPPRRSPTAALSPAGGKQTPALWIEPACQHAAPADGSGAARPLVELAARKGVLVVNKENAHVTAPASVN